MKNRIVVSCLFLLGGAPVCVAPSARAQTAPAAPAAASKIEIIQAGELRLDGQIIAMLGAGEWSIQAISWTSPRGVTTGFDEPKTKQIKFDETTYLHPRGEEDKVKISEVKVGARVAVIGKNGPGGVLVAREIVLLEGYGSHEMVGEATAHPLTGALIDQARAAHDAGDEPRALKLLLRAIDTAQGLRDLSGEALATQDLAIHYDEHNEPKKAFEASKRVEALGHTLANPLFLSVGMSGVAEGLYEQGKVAEAIAKFEEAVPISTKAPISIHLSALSALSGAYRGAGRLDDAIGVLKRLQPLEEANGKIDDATESALLIALFQTENDTDSARDALISLNPRIEASRDEAKKAYLLGLNGAIQWRLNDKTAARASFEAAAERFTAADDEKTATIWRAMAQSLTAAGDDFASQWNVLQGEKPAREEKPQNEQNGDEAANENNVD